MGSIKPGDSLLPNLLEILLLCMSTGTVFKKLDPPTSLGKEGSLMGIADSKLRHIMKTISRAGQNSEVAVSTWILARLTAHISL